MIRVDRRSAVVIATIDRPDRRNAVDHATLIALKTAIDGAASARVLVLTGSGDAFCAGADLTGVEDAGFAAALKAVLVGLTELPIVTLAAVDGPALGAGTQLALACDLRVATARSRFGIPAARLGLAVDEWTIRRLVAEAGAPIARAMLLGAAPYTAAPLHAAGFVHRLGGLDDALAWADELALLAPITVSAHKRGLEIRNSADAAAFEALLEKAWRSDDAHEGRTAFLEKRPPRFSGR